MRSRALLFAFLIFAACRSGTLDGNPSGSACASTPVTCGGITCGPFEACLVTSTGSVCTCGAVVFTTTANATGCACSGTDDANPGCGDETSPISSEAQCFSSNDLSVLDISVFDEANSDLPPGTRQCSSATTQVICGAFSCPTGAWCDNSTPSASVCRCGDDAVPDGVFSVNCACDGSPDPNNAGCLLGPASC